MHCLYPAMPQPTDKLKNFFSDNVRDSTFAEEYYCKTVNREWLVSRYFFLQPAGDEWYCHEQPLVLSSDSRKVNFSLRVRTDDNFYIAAIICSLEIS